MVDRSVFHIAFTTEAVVECEEQCVVAARMRSDYDASSMDESSGDYYQVKRRSGSFHFSGQDYSHVPQGPIIVPIRAYNPQPCCQPQYQYQQPMLSMQPMPMAMPPMQAPMPIQPMPNTSAQFVPQAPRPAPSRLSVRQTRGVAPKLSALCRAAFMRAIAKQSAEFKALKQAQTLIRGQAKFEPRVENKSDRLETTNSVPPSTRQSIEGIETEAVETTKRITVDKHTTKKASVPKSASERISVGKAASTRKSIEASVIETEPLESTKRSSVDKHTTKKTSVQKSASERISVGKAASTRKSIEGSVIESEPLESTKRSSLDEHTTRKTAVQKSASERVSVGKAASTRRSMRTARSSVAGRRTEKSSEGTIDGTIDGTIEGTVERTVEGTVDGTRTVEGTGEGTIDGTVDGTVEKSALSTDKLEESIPRRSASRRSERSSASRRSERSSRKSMSSSRRQSVRSVGSRRSRHSVSQASGTSQKPLSVTGSRMTTESLGPSSRSTISMEPSSRSNRSEYTSRTATGTILNSKPSSEKMDSIRSIRSSEGPLASTSRRTADQGPWDSRRTPTATVLNTELSTEPSVTTPTTTVPTTEYAEEGAQSSGLSNESIGNTTQYTMSTRRTNGGMRSQQVAASAAPPASPAEQAAYPPWIAETQYTAGRTATGTVLNTESSMTEPTTTEPTTEYVEEAQSAGLSNESIGNTTQYTMSTRRTNGGMRSQQVAASAASPASPAEQAAYPPWIAETQYTGRTATGTTPLTQYTGRTVPATQQTSTESTDPTTEFEIETAANESLGNTTQYSFSTRRTGRSGQEAYSIGESDIQTAGPTRSNMQSTGRSNIQSTGAQQEAVYSSRQEAEYQEAREEEYSVEPTSESAASLENTTQCSFSSRTRPPTNTSPSPVRSRRSRPRSEMSSTTFPSTMSSTEDSPTTEL